MSRLALAHPLVLITLAALGACADDGTATSALDHELALTLGRGPAARALAVHVGAATVDGPRVDYAITVAGTPGHVAYDLATGARTIALPFFSQMTAAQVTRVCETLEKIVEKTLMNRKPRF